VTFAPKVLRGMVKLVSIILKHLESLVEQAISFLHVLEQRELFALKQQHNDALSKTGIVGAKGIILHSQIKGSLIDYFFLLSLPLLLLCIVFSFLEVGLFEFLVAEVEEIEFE
jgi:hypothetical protein